MEDLTPVVELPQLHALRSAESAKEKEFKTLRAAFIETRWAGEVAFCGQTFTVTQKRKVPNSPEDTKDPYGLSCADADTVDLSPLKELTNIRELYLEDTGAEDLSTLSQLKQPPTCSSPTPR